MGRVLPREKTGVESVPWKILTRLTSETGACLAGTGGFAFFGSALRDSAANASSVPVPRIAAPAARPVDFRKERRSNMEGRSGALENLLIGTFFLTGKDTSTTPCFAY